MIIFKTTVYLCQRAMCEEKERKDKTVEEDVSIAGEAKAGGVPSEAL